MEKVEKLLEELNLSQQNLMSIIKIEKEGKKIKELERDLSKINMLIKALLSYKSYHTIKDNTSKEIKEPKELKPIKQKKIKV